MKNKAFYLILTLLFSPLLFAQQTYYTSPGIISILPNHQVNMLIEAHKNANAKKHTTQGFRVQIIQDSSREAVRQQKAALLKKFPQLRAYEVYDQPFFKLRVGDYLHRFEAFKVMHDLKSTFPASFIVQDKVNISEL
ncbi:MAG: SPOR domain-containing protein [Sphingobacteriales bacterium]|nr:MAG: SPOR domain-containing protein [Sphingobacteriales bacterium]